MRRLTLWLVVLAALVAAGCSSGGGRSSGPDSGRRPSSSAATTATSTSTSTSTTAPAGGTAGSTTTVGPLGPGPATKAEFLQKANALCASTDADLSAKARATLASDDAPVEDFLTKVALPAYTSLVSDLRALGSPPGHQATLEHLYGEFQQVLSFARAQAKVAPTKRKDDTAAISRLNGDLADFGLTSCAYGPGG